MVSGAVEMGGGAVEVDGAAVDVVGAGVAFFGATAGVADVGLPLDEVWGVDGRRAWVGLGGGRASDA